MKVARSAVTVAGLALSLLAAPLAAEAQEYKAGKVARIGYLSGGGATSEAHLVDEFRRGLRQLGYSDGHTMTIEARWAEGRAEKLSDLAEELLRLKVDVLFTRGTPAALAAKRATASLPIVAITGNPVEFGLLSSLAKAGGNITGLTIVAELVVKRLSYSRKPRPRVLASPSSGILSIPRWSRNSGDCKRRPEHWV